MTTPQERGREFEKELAEELGLDQVPGSGSVWHSKLDMVGNAFRWSLKFTESLKRFPITYDDIEEALNACYGIGGDGATPIWAFRCYFGDFILMRKEDFKSFQHGDVKIINIDSPKVAERKKKASLPELLREY